MTIFEVTDKLMRAVNGAVSGLGSKWDSEYIESLLPQVRSTAVSLAYNGSRTQAANKMISGDWLQTLNVTIPLNLQNKQANYLTVSVPPLVRINDRTNGAVYVGNTLSAITFIQAFSKSEVADLAMRGFLQGGEIVYLITGSNFEIYGDMSLKGFQIQGVFQDPLDITGFNPYTDNYPIDVQTFDIMKDLFVAKARVEMGTTSDQISDDAQTAELGVLKNNIK